jgi:hypothetical protein
LLLRRLAEHLRSQNWFAVGLDLLVVVVGIFLAFQVERWYADQRARADAQDRIDALVEDFVNNRQELEFQVERRQAALDAASALLKLDEENPTEADYETFYQLLARASRVSTIRFRRGSYDVLISTGEIDLIDNRALRADIAAFFALLEELKSTKEISAARQIGLFEAYVVENLDHVQMLESLHPPNEPVGIEQSRATQDKSSFLEILGTAPFEGVVGSMWHAARDELRQLSDLEDSLDSIQARLNEFASDPVEVDSQ